MYDTINHFFHVEHPDPDVRRRARNIILIAIGLIVCSLALVAIWYLQADYLPAAAAVVVVLSALATLAVVRRGIIDRVALAQALLIVIVTFGQIVGSGSLRNGAFFLLVPILIGVGTLTPRQYFAMVSVVLAGFAACSAWLSGTLSADRIELNTFQDSATLIIFTALVGTISVVNARHAASEIVTAREASERAAAELALVNVSLEERIAARTRELADSLNRERTQTTELQASLARQRDLDQLVRNLALPIIPVRPDVLVTPLAGALDGERISQLRGQILDQIEQRHARAIILDVTGVAVIDSQIAQALARIAAAARLLGARTILAGIRPEVAQALVSLGADLSAIEAAATLYEGLRTIDQPSPLYRAARP